ncbi:MAG: FxsA family protein [Gammaproteobacteria bacterium]|nr:FxsA family protein [Gammaproteobacteria bacterium]
MFRILFLVFLIVPIVEIYLLIKVGGVIGAIPTIGLVVGTAVLGAYLLKYQGLSTFARMQKTLAMGEIPALEVLEGVVLLITGALLLTPGFFTDTLGFLGLIPGLRRGLVLWLLKHVNIIQPRPPGGGNPGRKGGDPHVIEGEYRRED